MLGHIHNLCLHDLTQLHNFPAVVLVVFDLDQHQFPGDTLVLRKGLHLDHIQLLVELFFNLLYGAFVPAADNGHTGYSCIVCLPHGQAVNVKTSTGKESGHLTQHAGAVLHQYRINPCLHLVRHSNLLLPSCRFHIPAIKDAINQ